MNLCIISGRIISEIKYNFLYDYKYNVAIVYFKLKLSNKTQIDVYAFDEMADKIYAELKWGDFLLAESKIRTLRKIRSYVV